MVSFPDFGRCMNLYLGRNRMRLVEMRGEGDRTLDVAPW